MSEVNEPFWRNPPWQGGVPPQRLGLRPMDPAAWLAQTPNEAERNNKLEQLRTRYSEVVQMTEHGRPLDAMLRQLAWPGVCSDQFPDLIANLALCVSDDLCVIDVQDQQRLVAACLCAPSYWHLLEKIGRPLAEVHAPVTGLNRKLGANIKRFIERAPRGQPFARSNWFVHGDAHLFHNQPEADLDMPVAQWIVRSERQTLCRCTERYLLFTIRITCVPLAHIALFPLAQRDMRKSLQMMDEDEVAHFGGLAKCRQLADYVASL
ncbi:MAG: heme-dependent oxidative N-demethylase subunit alpha family protein [bacterium]